jgi:predicted DNA-binding transcriptional regulator AlpA
LAFIILVADAQQQLTHQIFFLGVFVMHRSKTVSSSSPSESHHQAQVSSTTLPISERKFLRAKDGANYLSISKSHFHALVKDGILPPGKLISRAIRVWKRASLEEAAEKMWEGCK